MFCLVVFFPFTHLSFLKFSSTHSSDYSLILPTSLLQSSDPAFSSLLSVCPFSIGKLESIHTCLCVHTCIYIHINPSVCNPPHLPLIQPAPLLLSVLLFFPSRKHSPVSERWLCYCCLTHCIPSYRHLKISESSEFQHKLPEDSVGTPQCQNADRPP